MSYNIDTETLEQFDDNGLWTCPVCETKHRHEPKLDAIEWLLQNEFSGEYSEYNPNTLRYNDNCHCGIHEIVLKSQTGRIPFEKEEKKYLAQIALNRPIPESVGETMYIAMDTDMRNIVLRQMTEEAFYH